MHTLDDCEDQKEDCDAGCRSIPESQRFKRMLCWSACMSEYAACIGTAKEVLVPCCYAGAVILVVATPGVPDEALACSLAVAAAAQ